MSWRTMTTSPIGAGTIFKFTPMETALSSAPFPVQTGENDPQENWGLAFDSAGNLYAAER